MNGHVTYVFDLGDGPVRIKDTSKSKLNDNKWHTVSIGRPASKRHTLAVDDHIAAINSQGSNENLDLDGILYIGWYHSNNKAKQSTQNERKKFNTCIAESLDAHSFVKTRKVEIYFSYVLLRTVGMRTTL